MAYTYKNITGNSAQVLLSKNLLSNRPIEQIAICNSHSSDNVTIDLYLYKTNTSNVPDKNNDWTPVTTTNKYWIVRNFLISNGSTVKFEKDDFLINYKASEYDLYIKLSTADGAADIIINN
tara:strand:- start:5653 stop:6015 length:363 start_codon:yes stop_codon:yes gene_type:complete